MTPAERMRLYRERKNAGLLTLKSIAITPELQNRLIARGYMETNDVDKKEAIRAAVEEFLEDYADGTVMP